MFERLCATLLEVSINRLLFGPEFRYQAALGKDVGLGLHFSVKGIWDTIRSP